MTTDSSPKAIVLDLIARHGLVVIALAFLAWFILTQVETQQKDLSYWRETMAQVNMSRKQDADRFFDQMNSIHERLARVEIICRQQNTKEDIGP